MSKVIDSVLVIVSLGLILVLAWFIFFSEKGLMALELSDQKKQEIALQNQVLQEQNRILSGEIERLRSDLDYICDVARYDLGMVAPDEIIYKP